MCFKLSTVDSIIGMSYVVHNNGIPPLTFLYYCPVPEFDGGGEKAYIMVHQPTI